MHSLTNSPTTDSPLSVFVYTSAHPSIQHISPCLFVRACPATPQGLFHWLLAMTDASVRDTPQAHRRREHLWAAARALAASSSSDLAADDSAGLLTAVMLATGNDRADLAW
jgi:hypothetical protein